MLKYLCHGLWAIAQVLPVVDRWRIIELDVARVVERRIRRDQVLVKSRRHCDGFHGRAWLIGAIQSRIEKDAFRSQTTGLSGIVAVLVGIEGWRTGHRYHRSCT